MRRHHLVLVVVAIAVLAGCGSGGGTKTTSTTTATHQVTSPARKHTAKPTKPAKAAPAGSPFTQPPHGPVLTWIKHLQHDLTTLHFYSGPITGRDSGLTKTAIVRFQRAAHLKPDGLWGPNSQAALDKMLHRKPRKSPPPLAWIKRLQRDLTRLRFYSGSITGVDNNQTKAAIIRFQRAAHLKPDGLWGTKSQTALDKMLHRT